MRCEKKNMIRRSEEKKRKRKKGGSARVVEADVALEFPGSGEGDPRVHHSKDFGLGGAILVQQAKPSKTKQTSAKGGMLVEWRHETKWGIHSTKK